MTEDQFKYIIANILERGVEAKAEAEGTADGSFERGRRLAYWEVLDMIKSRIVICGQDPADYGLGDDLENAIL